MEVSHILLLPECNPDALERFVSDLDRNNPMEDFAFQANKRLLRSLSDVGDYFMMGNYADKYLATRLGFDYQSHFCTGFRRKFGMSPTDYRAQHHAFLPM